MLAERQGSPSPSRKLSLGSKISALGAKLSRTLNPSERETDSQGEENDSVSPILPELHTERSLSRGREAFQSTGRGGIGNIRQSSASRDARPGSGPDDFSVTRGREPIANPNQVFSTGRGGAGNLRSPSRDPNSRPLVEIEASEQEVIREYVAGQEGAVFSSGRGGLGNMNRSRSRDPSSTTAAPKFSTGRGGAGNIVSGDGHAAELIDEEERRKHAHAHGTEGLHSTGRGGAANITSTQEPAVERHAHGLHAHEFESTGRGGAGNIVRDRSGSRQRT